MKTPPPGDVWIHEIKLDGSRLLVRFDGREVQVDTRAENDWTEISQLDGLYREI